MCGEGFTKRREGAWTVWLAEGFGSGQDLSIMRQCCEVFSETVEAIEMTAGLWKIHGGERSVIYGAEFAGEKYCIKLFTDRRLKTRIRTFLGFSKGRRAFRNALLAAKKRIPVPRVYFCAERKPFGPSMVVMKILEAVQMNLLIEDMVARGADLASDPFFVRMVEAFAKFTRGMHEAAVCHDDFSPRNVLVSVDGATIRLSMIDLEDVVFSCSKADFRRNIDHFSGKMARYIDPAALEIFQRTFKENYGDQEYR